MNRLIDAVEGLRNNTARVQHANEQESSRRSQNQNNEEVMRQLYPSVNGNANIASGNVASGNQRHNSSDAPDRVYVSQINKFNPSSNYRPKKGKRKETQATGEKRKRSAAAEKSLLKDVLLLPSPTNKEVPRGARREELYSENFAVSAFEITDEMSEAELRQKLGKAFASKLDNLAEPKFNFVRAVGNKIIDPGCQSYSGKIIKHLTRQGPLYIRAVTDIDKLWNTCDDAVSNSDDSDGGRSNRSAFDEGEPSKEVKERLDDDDDVLFISAFGPDDASTSAMSSASTVTESSGTNTSQRSVITVMVNCPTCNSAFPSNEIAEHADICAETAEGITHSRQMYGNLLMEFPDDHTENSDAHEVTAQAGPDQGVSNSNNKSLKDHLESLQLKVEQETSRIYVRRKRLWEDYLHTSKHGKWFKPENHLKVNFIGEPAVDGGGPRREFLSGKVHIYKLF